MPNAVLAMTRFDGDISHCLWGRGCWRPVHACLVECGGLGASFSDALQELDERCVSSSTAQWQNTDTPLRCLLIADLSDLLMLNQRHRRSDEPQSSQVLQQALTGAHYNLINDRCRTPMREWWSGKRPSDHVVRTPELVSHPSRLQRQLHSTFDCNVHDLLEFCDSRPARSGVHAKVLRDHLACNRVLFCQPHHAQPPPQSS